MTANLLTDMPAIRQSFCMMCKFNLGREDQSFKNGPFGAEVLENDECAAPSISKVKFDDDTSFVTK